MAFLSRFSTWRICSREQRNEQLDWLATNTDVITTQSHLLFLCSREQIRQVENRLKARFPLHHFFGGKLKIVNKNYVIGKNISPARSEMIEWKTGFNATEG